MTTRDEYPMRTAEETHRSLLLAARHARALRKLLVDVMCAIPGHPPRGVDLTDAIKIKCFNIARDTLYPLRVENEHD